MISKGPDVIYDTGEVMVTIPDKFTPVARAKYAVLFAASEELFLRANSLREAYCNKSLETLADALKDFTAHVGRLEQALYTAKRKAEES